MPGIQTLTSLQNQFLIAMPSLTDRYFMRSVIYVAEHSAEGAMGIVINQPSSMTFRELIKQTDKTAIINEDFSEKIIVCGGPVYPDRGFVVHSSQSGWSSSVEVSSEIMITTSKDILSVLGNEKGPRKSVIALGYAGWDAGQLEKEIADNAWLTVPADEEILFDVPIKNKWQATMQKLGVDVWQLSQFSGSA